MLGVEVVVIVPVSTADTSLLAISANDSFSIIPVY